MSDPLLPRVFYAEDDEDDQDTFRELIGTFPTPVEIDIFNDGLFLIQHLEANKHAALPALIVLDINMPLWDGLQTLSALRRNARYDPVPIVMLSTSTLMSDRNRCMALGANDYLRKPNIKSELAEIANKLHAYILG